MKYAMFSVVFFGLSGCSHTPMEKKQAAILDCVKELKEADAETMDAFEICRQTYRLKKVKELQ